VVKIATAQNETDELIPLRTILINSLTEEHIDSGDWAGGWAWIGVLGEFSGGDLCLSQLGIRAPMPAGPLWEYVEVSSLSVIVGGTAVFCGSLLQTESTPPRGSSSGIRVTTARIAV
jgi:hypothetical protein